MQPVQKTSTAKLAAEAIRENIETGRWEDRLPGARVLAKRLGISPPTVAMALALLVEQGTLTNAGERRAFRIAQKPNHTPSTHQDPKAKRLLIITHEEQHQLTESARRCLERLREQASAKNWQVNSQVVNFNHVKTPQRSWDRIIQVDPGTSVIVLHGRETLAEWAVKRNVRMIFLGGITDGLPIPLIGVKSTNMLETVLARLTAMGHWRIILPLCDRPEHYKAALREMMRHMIEATGHKYVRSYHNPESDYLKTDVTWRIVETAMKIEPPTAMIFLDWHELITAHCLLARMGIRVPEDMSLVLLNDQLEAGWFVPELTRFRFPERKIVQHLIRWLEDGDKHRDHNKAIPVEFLEGATIAPPRSKLSPHTHQNP